MLLLVACTGATQPGSPPATEPNDTVPDTDSGGVDTGPSCVVEPEPPAEKNLGDPAALARLLTGTVVWTLEFDADAEAAGFFDCSYTRDYAGNSEVGDQGWLCPACTLLTTGSAVMSAGFEDCYVQISDSGSERIEHLGIGDVDGEPHFWRSGIENIALGDMGAATGDGPYSVAWTDEATLDAGGTMVLAATGELSVTPSEDLWIADVTGARTEPYTCGWPLNSPGGDNPTWTVADGTIFPNLRLEDQCAEAVDLWDFRGYYLVIDSSAPNCGPCQSMAASAEDFKARMADACVPVELITLLTAALNAGNVPAPLDVRQAWAAEFGLTSPVLGDRGAGYALLPDYLGIESGMSYPGIVVLSPAGVVLYGSSGFSDWGAIEAIIQADYAAGAE